MKYNDRIDDFCRLLETENHAPTDPLLAHAVKLQRIGETTASLFGHSLMRRPNFSMETVELLVEASKSQLQDLRSSLQPAESSTRELNYPLSRPMA